MQIGELSARTGTSVRMLRYYEDQGLLEPQRTASGYRIYAETDVDRVARIRCMLSAALPSGVVGKALKFLLDGRPAIPELPAERDRLAETLQSELNALVERIAALERSRDLLTTIIADVRGATVGPGNPGDPGNAAARTSVRKSGPAVGESPPRKGTPPSTTRCGGDPLTPPGSHRP